MARHSPLPLSHSVGCCNHMTGPQRPLEDVHPPWRLMAHLAIALPGPGEGGGSLCPAPYSQASVKSSGKALKGKCLSNVGPEAALPSPQLISSCPDSQFYFRNKRLSALFTLQPDSRSPLRLCSPVRRRLDFEVRDGKAPGVQGRSAGSGSSHGPREKQGAGGQTCGSSSAPSLGPGHMRPQLQLRIPCVVIVTTTQESAWCWAVHKACRPWALSVLLGGRLQPEAHSHQTPATHSRQAPGAGRPWRQACN